MIVGLPIAPTVQSELNGTETRNGDGLTVLLLVVEVLRRTEQRQITRRCPRAIAEGDENTAVQCIQEGRVAQPARVIGDVLLLSDERCLHGERTTDRRTARGQISEVILQNGLAGGQRQFLSVQLNEQTEERSEKKQHFLGHRWTTKDDEER